MKKIIPFFTIIIASCSTVKNHNAHLNDLIAVEDLRSDVDYTYQKMKDMHPKLYWYISEKNLNYKFDSLKTTITKPITSYEFYKKIAPIVGSVGQGHMMALPNTKLYSYKQIKATKEKGIGPISQFDFELFDNKLYVVKNKTYDKSVAVGTEILAINGRKTEDFMKEYNTFFTSDGYNKTFKKNRLPKLISRYFSQEYGTKDTINYVTKYNNSEKTISVIRKKIDTINKKVDKNKIFTDQEKVANKIKAKALKIKHDVEGYNKETKDYQRNLRFIEKDSAVAIIKIRGFSNGDYEIFYKQSFKKIQDYKSKTLILDLRNNGGGRLAEINNLYSFLAEKEYVFLKDSPVVSKTSLFNVNYFEGAFYWLPFKVAISPFVYSFLYLRTTKKDDGNVYWTNNKLKKLNEFNFKGKIYVLINGGSFSASSIISSNLQGSKRATFVGEETGGAYNGTVAGQMPLVKIPNSKIKVRIGLVGCIPFYNDQKEGRGVFPDQEIIPTLQDRIDEKDPEIDWVLNDLKRLQ